jgi:hypothetical protein
VCGTLLRVLALANNAASTSNPTSAHATGPGTDPLRSMWVGLCYIQQAAALDLADSAGPSCSQECAQAAEPGTWLQVLLCCTAPGQAGAASRRARHMAAGAALLHGEQCPTALPPAARTSHICHQGRWMIRVLLRPLLHQHWRQHNSRMCACGAGASAGAAGGAGSRGACVQVLRWS